MFLRRCISDGPEEWCRPGRFSSRSIAGCLQWRPRKACRSCRHVAQWRSLACCHKILRLLVTTLCDRQAGQSRLGWPGISLRCLTTTTTNIHDRIPPASDHFCRCINTSGCRTELSALRRHRGATRQWRAPDSGTTRGLPGMPPVMPLRQTSDGFRRYLAGLYAGIVCWWACIDTRHHANLAIGQEARRRTKTLRTQTL